MNRIFIHDLRLETRIGVYAWEQHLSQPLILNLEMEMPSARALASDKIADALDYAAVVRRLQELAANHPQKLLERFAAAAVEVVLTEFGAPWLRLSVAKPAPISGVRQIGVVLERGRKSLESE